MDTAHQKRKTGNLKQLLIILQFAILTSGFTQQAYVDAAISASTVTDNDNFSYKITTDCDCDIIAPDLSDFDILQRAPGKFNSTTSINGVTKSTCSSTLEFILRAKKKGKFKIGRAKVKCKNEDARSDEISIEVLDAGTVFEANEGTADFYYKIVCNKNSVMQGEPFLINFYLYSAKRPQDITTITSGGIGGAWRQNLFNEMAANFAFPMGTETVKGKKYYVIHLRKEVAIANNPGKLKIDPYFGRAVDQYDFFNSSYFEDYSNAEEIKVNPIPGEKPENFYGMVGDFELTHTISKTKTQANRAIELKVKVSGSGNFHHYQDPSFLFPESFLVSDPEYKENLQATEKGIEGNVEYTFVITPTKEGQYSILPYSFAYYSLTEQKIKAVTTEAFTIDVTKGNDVAVHGPETQTEFTEDDIRFIHKNDMNFFHLGDQFFGGLFYYLLLLCPLGIAFIFFILRRKKSKQTDEELSQHAQKTVRKTAVKDIRQIKKQGKSADPKENIKQLKTTLDDYLMTHLKVGRSGLSKSNILSLLNSKAIDQSLCNQFAAIWDKIEMAQFAPMSSENVDQLIAETESFFKSINGKI